MIQHNQDKLTLTIVILIVFSTLYFGSHVVAEISTVKPNVTKILNK